MDEDTFKSDDLSKHITGYITLRIVSTGEDTTRVIGRADYNSETNRCIGFMLPPDDHGLPLAHSFLAISFVAIEKMFITKEHTDLHITLVSLNSRLAI